MPRNSRRNNDTNSANYWPGFVDVMATILLVIIFLLTVFILSQFYLSTEISSKDDALSNLRNQLQELSSLLSLEEAENQELMNSIQSLEADLADFTNQNNDLILSLGVANDKIILLQDEITQINNDYEDKIIILEDNLNKQIDIFNTKRDESAERNNKIISLVSENNKISSLLNMKESELKNKNKKMNLYQNEILALTENTELVNKKLDEKEQLIIDLRKKEKINTDKISEYVQRLDNLNLSSSDLQIENIENEQKIIDLRNKEIDSNNKIEKLKKGIISTGKKAMIADQNLKLLTIQLLELKKQITSLQALLDESAQKDVEQQARISDLGKKLNVALARKVKELSEYRSEFFGKLKKVIGNRDDIKIIGDRFVFQSEVLFASGEANIGIEGQIQLARLSVAVQDLMNEIPPEINWIIRIDGHTDSIPINNSRYQSNWHLSAARAISVVEFLNRTGIPANRLAATGRGEFIPLDSEQNEEAYKKNRRIEIKLTES